MSKRNSQYGEKAKKEEKLNTLELKIIEILTEISNQNSNVEYNPDDPFSSKSPPKITIKHFIGRIKKYSQIEKSTLIIILIYADRMCTTSGIILNPHNIHRIILGCLLLAIKYNEDIYFTNEHYAKVGGVSIKELNELEYVSMEFLNFNLFIGEDIYQKYLKFITNYSAEKS
jgi:hypothetical protein